MSMKDAHTNGARQGLAECCENVEGEGDESSMESAN